jgi:hypothetical protein
MGRSFAHEETITIDLYSVLFDECGHSSGFYLAARSHILRTRAWRKKGRVRS